LILMADSSGIYALGDIPLTRPNHWAWRASSEPPYKSLPPADPPWAWETFKKILDRSLSRVVEDWVDVKSSGDVAGPGVRGPQGPDRLIIYDTTLRDGNQAFAVNFSVEDKLKIARKLDELGVHYIEGGWPNPTNPSELEFFKRVKLEGLSARIAAFGMTKRPRSKPEEDQNLNHLLEAEPDCITIFGKTWKLHVARVLETTPEENLAMIGGSIEYIKAHGYEVIYDAEHFFDGYKDDPSYALETLRVAFESGAEQIVLCDTRGASLPTEVFKATEEVVRKFPRAVVGIHAHNDKGLATANSLFALMAGARHVQGTINGIGERCGNADLIEVLGNAELSLGIRLGIDLSALSKVSSYVYEIAGLTPNDRQPFVGKCAFAHKGGVHGHAVLKCPEAYEFVDPSILGGSRFILVSSQAGRANLLAKAKEFGYDLERDDPRLARILERVKEMEGEGYHFENADATLDLVLARSLGIDPRYFEIEGWRVIVSGGKGGVSSESTVKLRVDGEELLTASEGNGPVNAFDLALRKALGSKYRELSKVNLVGYRVREIDVEHGTAAKVRVHIEFEADGRRWSTIGVSTNILEASKEALEDGYLYYLYRIRDPKRSGG
jgi:2-isopropylmalate synthase